MSAPRALTLFDLDGTLIQTDSDHAFGDFLVAQGWADAETFRRRNDAFYADYLAGTLDLETYIDFATSAWRHRTWEEAVALRERFMQEVMRPHIQPQALALVRQHVAAGDLVAIVTATNEFVTGPIAETFGVEHLLAVQLSRAPDGRVDGRIHGTPTFQAGKITRVRQWLDALGHSPEAFGAVTVYSDSTNDLPLLEWASHPVATNPSPALEAIARQRNWRILQLFS